MKNFYKSDTQNEWSFGDNENESGLMGRVG